MPNQQPQRNHGNCTAPNGPSLRISLRLLALTASLHFFRTINILDLAAGFRLEVTEMHSHFYTLSIEGLL